MAAWPILSLRPQGGRPPTRVGVLAFGQAQEATLKPRTKVNVNIGQACHIQRVRSLLSVATRHSYELNTSGGFMTNGLPEVTKCHCCASRVTAEITLRPVNLILAIKTGHVNYDKLSNNVRPRSRALPNSR
jgi:hypothetical protein